MSTLLKGERLQRRLEIEEFYASESALLDARDLTGWLRLVADDFTYRVPTTTTVDTASRSAWNEKFLIVDETKASIRDLWAIRYSPDHVEFAWGENPPQRTRRYVTGVRVATTETEGEFEVAASVLLSFARESEPTHFLTAGRKDVLRHEGDDFLLAKRTVYIDQRVITTGHLRLVF
ncbi:aromatic-ring-hydroxylating dioxygenase subunit beta [Streptomyces sp. NPDC005134]|uniref:aromatic-ring-hydroxylating dioxygenase subunit beta n=1 Tax=Streptomyces sp. NPDC005098 TaxID=3154560 RepID=UPI0033A61045